LTVHVPVGQTLLHAVRGVRIDDPSGCEAGLRKQARLRSLM
jgi:hypothetical protein